MTAIEWIGHFRVSVFSGTKATAVIYPTPALSRSFPWKVFGVILIFLWVVQVLPLVGFITNSAWAEFVQGDPVLLLDGPHRTWRSTDHVILFKEVLLDADSMVIWFFALVIGFAGSVYATFDFNKTSKKAP